MSGGNVGSGSGEGGYGGLGIGNPGSYGGSNDSMGGYGGHRGLGIGNPSSYTARSSRTSLSGVSHGPNMGFDPTSVEKGASLMEAARNDWGYGDVNAASKAAVESSLFGSLANAVRNLGRGIYDTGAKIFGDMRETARSVSTGLLSGAIEGVGYPVAQAIDSFVDGDPVSDALRDFSNDVAGTFIDGTIDVFSDLNSGLIPGWAAFEAQAGAGSVRSDVIKFRPAAKKNNTVHPKSGSKANIVTPLGSRSYYGHLYYSASKGKKVVRKIFK